MGLFYAIAGALALATALLLIRPLLAGRGSVAGRDARDAQLYRDQLAEIDRDVERGAISRAEAEGARAEVSRRLLAASGRAGVAVPAAPAPRALSASVAAAVLIGAPALAVVLYLANGAPGMPDLPLATRPAEAPAARIVAPSQAEAEAAIAATPSEPTQPLSPDGQNFADLIARLEGILAARPDDAQGLRLLASGYARLGRHAEAWQAYEKLIGLLGAGAEPELYAAQLDAMAIAAGGYVSPEAEAVLAKALSLKPDMPVARYYSGLLLAQKGNLDQAIAVWDRLHAESPPEAPWMAFLGDMLAQAKALRSGQPGPDAAAVEAAAGLSADERQAMIESMVARLEDRLTTEGGEVEEWLRLINAYMQLGRPDDARRIYGLGSAALAGSEAGFLREQALTMGVISE